MSDNIIQLNEAAIKGELKDLVRNSVEETLNSLLDHEADELVNAERYLDMMDVKRGKKDLHAALDDMQNLEAGLRLKIKNYLNRNKLYIDDILPSDLDTLVEKAKRRIGEE